MKYLVWHKLKSPMQKLNKTMKKIYSFVLGLALLVLGAQAWGQAGSGTYPQWGYQSFINPYCNSITVSNKLMGVSNLLSTWKYGSAKAMTATNVTSGLGTNYWGISFTNLYGQSCFVTNNAVLTNTFGTFEDLNLLQDVKLWTDRTGMPGVWPYLLRDSNSFASVFIKLAGTSGANSAVNFYFVPLVDGTNEVTQAGEEWVVGVTATTTTPVSIYTNVPNKFIGVRGFRLRAINNTDVDATSRVDLYNCALIGFGP